MLFKSLSCGVCMAAPEADTVTGSIPSDGLWVSYFPSGRAYLDIQGLRTSSVNSIQISTWSFSMWGFLESLQIPLFLFVLSSGKSINALANIQNLSSVPSCDWPMEASHDSDYQKLMTCIQFSISSYLQSISFKTGNLFLSETILSLFGCVISPMIPLSELKPRKTLSLWFLLGIIFGLPSSCWFGADSSHLSRRAAQGASSGGRGPHLEWVGEWWSCPGRKYSWVKCDFRQENCPLSNCPLWNPQTLTVHTDY